MTHGGLSVVVPAYNEAAHLAGNMERLLACLGASGRRIEVLIVDDGSTDGSGDVAQRLAAADERVRAFRHHRNRGKGRALATGVAHAAEDVIVLLDADLEIPPEDVLPLVERLEQSGADVAVGSKYHPGATLQWPLYRRALSRAYHVVTALLFRLPLRDTQTGLKAIRRRVARSLVPRLRARRFAWDLELLLLAHRDGRRFVTGPVHVRPASRASRVGWGGALQAGIDTVRIWWRDRALAGYGASRPARRRRTRLLVSGDDLGLRPDVDAGLVEGVAAGGLTSVSVLARGPTIDAALAALDERAASADVGMHLDLLGARSLPRFALRSLLGLLPRAYVATRFRDQHERLAASGHRPTHVDAHRHAYFLPWVRREACALAARAGIPAIRSLRPLGPHFSGGAVEGCKRLVLLAAATLSAGAARARGLAVPAGFVDAAEAARWVRRGRLPAYARGRTVEVIAHPALGERPGPPSADGTLDRRAEARYVLEPPLAGALAALGADVVDFGSLA
jgi:predicted glycoside hydrolase/deacetylase ChbG (UPF0249 family)